ncbi:hypothetical protein [Roseibium sp.]|uniref:hypothetical protein n=1 Tax=Roseibium sp. TaxID=1936156 RepID=UPI003D0D6B06
MTIPFRTVLIFLSLLMLSACQYNGETASVEEFEDVGPPLAVEVTGEGDTTLALVLPFAGSDALVSKQIRNGALLAQEMLSDGKLVLAVENGAGADYKALKNPALVAVYAPDGKLSPAPPKKSVTINIGAKPIEKGGLSIVAGDMDSLVAGLRYAAPSGAPVVILAPESQSDESLQAIAKAVSGTVEVVKYRSEASDKDLVALLKEMTDVVAVGFVEGDRKVAEVAAALKKRKVSPLIVGHTGWGTALVRNPKLEGAIIARPGGASRALVAQRYTAKFGSAPGEMSLYGFDIAAVASGLVRQHGKNGITRKRLTSSQGFKGALGSFRFREDGTVERLYEINKIVGGKLKIIQSAPAGF